MIGRLYWGTAIWRALEPVELALPLLLRLLSPADDVGEPERCLAGSARRLPNPSPKLGASPCDGGIDELEGAVAPSSKKPSASEGVGDGGGRAAGGGRGDAAAEAAGGGGSAPAGAFARGGPTFGTRGASRMGIPILATAPGRGAAMAAVPLAAAAPLFLAGAGGARGAPAGFTLRAP